MKTEAELKIQFDKYKVVISNCLYESDGFIGVMGDLKLNGMYFHFICSNGENWEHVSISTQTRCPTWNEMSFFKNLFWPETECVMELHPPKSEYVNNHKYCLHLWRPLEVEIPLPPTVLVGIKNDNPK